MADDNDFFKSLGIGDDTDDENEAPVDEAVEEEDEAEEVESEDEESLEDEVEEDEEDEDEEPDEDAQYEIPPTTVNGRTYTDARLLAQALDEAQTHISRTSREERTPLQPQGLSGLGLGGSSWETAWAALPEAEQNEIKAAFAAYPEQVALAVARNTTLVGPEISQMIFNEWAKSEPLKAMSELQRLDRLNQQAAQTAPEQDQYVAKLRAEAIGKEADDILSDVPGWSPEVAQEVAAYIDANKETLSLDAVEDTPEAMANYVYSVYVLMEGQKSLAARNPEAQAAAKKSARTKKAKASTPVRGDARPTTTDDDDDDPVMAIINARRPGFKLN